MGSGTLRRGADTADEDPRKDPVDPLRPVVDVFKLFAVAFEVMSSLAFVILSAFVTLIAVPVMLLSL